jgi:pyruvate/2-oxoglutarate dehydrogenase complex dihydrolipoamide acyltransferase (E2) component
MNAPEKVFFTGPMIYAEIFDPDVGVEFTVVYRDKKRIAYAKKIKIDKFIRNREYRLIKDKGGRIDLLLPVGQTGTVHMDFVPAKRQRLKKADFDLESLELTSASARGARMAPKPVAKMKLEAVESPKSSAKSSQSRTASPAKTPARKASSKKGPRSGEQGDLF